MNELLTKSDLLSVTGYVQPAAQLRWLNSQGIQAFRNGAGQVVATWHSVNHPTTSANDDAGPNFGALEVTI
jgi:hypothetical protein